MFMLYFESNQARQVGDRERQTDSAILTTYLFRYTSECAPFRNQIFKIFFASGGKGALAPLTKILRTYLVYLLRP